MKKLAVLTLALMLLVSCATAKVATTSKSGATCEASYTSMFKSLTDIEMKACGAGGQAGTSIVDPQAAVLMELILKALRTPVVVP